MNKQIIINVPHAIDISGDKRITNLSKYKPRVRKAGLDVIKRYLKESSEVIIIDPYFYKKGPNQSNLNYLDEFEYVISQYHKMKRVHIIYNKKYSDTSLRDYLHQNLKCEITDSHTNDIHDRVWVKDRNHGKLIGSSFNGIGRSKICFAITLPRQDLIDLKFYLQRNKLVEDEHLIIE